MNELFLVANIIYILRKKPYCKFNVIISKTNSFVVAPGAYRHFHSEEPDLMGEMDENGIDSYDANPRRGLEYIRQHSLILESHYKFVGRRQLNKRPTVVSLFILSSLSF